MNEIEVVISGVGAAGIAIAKLLKVYGVKNIVMVDSLGAIFVGRDRMNDEKKMIAEITNMLRTPGTLAETIA